MTQGIRFMISNRIHQVPDPCHALATRYGHKICDMLTNEPELPYINKSIIRSITGKPVNCLSKVPIQEALTYLNADNEKSTQTLLLKSNIRAVCQIFKVSLQMAPVLEFITVMNVNYGLKRLIAELNHHMETQPLEWLLTNISDMQIEEIAQALYELFEQGFFLYQAWVTEPQDIEITPAMLVALTTQQVNTKASLLQSLLFESPKSTLKRSQFDYVDTDLLATYLEQAISKQHTGINILFYGEAGSGKTELARVLTQELGLTLYEGRNLRVENGKLSNEIGAKSADTQRSQYVSMIQTLLQGASDTVLLVDECESLFFSADRHYSKETLHRLLEQNTVPCIWITNHIDLLEDSYIRRFKLVMEVSSPEQTALAALSKTVFKGLNISEAFTHEISQTKHLTPAIISNAGYIAKTLELKRKPAEDVIEDVIEHTLTACGLWGNPLRYQAQLPFDISLLNIKQPAAVLSEISHAVADGLPVRVLLSGPPGSGKTAFAHHLAELHQRKIKRVLSSDVLGKYVGESEKHIAALFHQAEQSKHVLLLDEVDSLLTSRAQLNMQHERQVVNELLAQMECFTQPLFAATNFETALDSAVLRRFDFKLECNYLTAEQVIVLYKRTVRVKTLTQEEVSTLPMLTRLTPGDFAIVARRMLVQPQQHRTLALTVLTDENTRKQPKPTIGFVR